jgi:hypothetical protein
MAFFTDYLYDFSVKEVLKLYSGRSFISQRNLREVRDHITTRIVQGEQIDADDERLMTGSRSRSYSKVGVI